MTPASPRHQHRVIGDASATIGRFLRDELVAAGYPDLVLVEAPPTADAIAALPALVLYLHQLAVDHEGVAGNLDGERLAGTDEDGAPARFLRRAPLWLRLDYVVAAFARSPRDEQILLGSSLRAAIDAPVLRGERLRGASFAPDAALPLSISSRPADELARLWSSVGQPVRPSLQLWTLVPLVPERLDRLAPTAERRPTVALAPR